MAEPDGARYATQPTSLQGQVDALLQGAVPHPASGEIVAAIVPDVNRLQGGPIAAGVYKMLEGRKYDTVILVAPSYSGSFGRIHICNGDTYKTVLGDLRVNDQIRNELCDEDDDIFLDNEGHFQADGISVQLPFLQTVLESNFAVVPIVMGDESPDFCRELGNAIGEIMYSRRALLVATAHLETGDEEDLEVFRSLLEAGDVSRLMALLNSDRVRVKGKGPLLVSLIATLHRKADTVRIVEVKAPAHGEAGFFGAVIARN